MRPFLRIIDQKGFSVLILMITDFLMCLFAYLSAYFLRSTLLVSHFEQTKLQPLIVYLNALPVVFLLMFFVFYSLGLYERKNRINGLMETYHVLRGVTFSVLFIMAASFLAKYDYSRTLVVLFWFFAMTLIGLGRYLIRHIKIYYYSKGKYVTNLLIVGAGKTGRKVFCEIQDYGHFGYKVCGFADDYVKVSEGSPYVVLGRTRELAHLIKKYAVDEVFIADPAMSHEKILSLIYSCESLDVKFKVVSGLFEVVSGGVDISEIEGIPSLDMKKSEVSIFYLISKRILDLFCAVVGLLFFLPLWVLLGICIKLDSKGPVIFAQERVGLNSKLFTMWKFRTMFNSTNRHDYSPKSNKDPRITRVGRFLRKTSLDEVPQFYNVLIGNMSMVGPRPEMKFIVDKYSKWQLRRLDVKPGVTGLWQILGRKDLPLHENIEYDFYYIKNRSIFLDIVIILKTIQVALSGKGAY